MTRPRALVIDDEPDICELLTLTLGRMDIDTDTAEDVTGAKALLESRSFDLCLTDMRLPDGDGLELVEWMQSHASGTPVAVITAHGNVETAVQALKLGAFDFISKPLDLNNLRSIIATALQLEAADTAAQDGLLGESEPQPVGDRRRQHAVDALRQIQIGGSLAGREIHVATRAHQCGHIGDVDPQTIAVDTDGIIRILVADIVDRPGL